MKTVHLKIKGRVQGVFFRVTAREVARRYHISGWIKNTVDDNVEAIITGETEAIRAFISWSKKGPEKAKVSEVSVTDLELKKFDSFEIIR